MKQEEMEKMELLEAFYKEQTTLVKIKTEQFIKDMEFRDKISNSEVALVLIKENLSKIYGKE